MYCDINDILDNLDENTLIQLTNHKNLERSSIDLDDTEDPIVVIADKQIQKAQDEIDPFLIPLGVLPFSKIPSRIKTLCITLAIKNLYQQSPGFRVNMPESIISDYKDAIKELDAYRKKERTIPGLETTASAKQSSEVKVNKTEDDRIFNSDMWEKF